MPSRANVSQFTTTQQHALDVAAKLDQRERGPVHDSRVLVSDVLGKITFWNDDRGFGFITLAKSQDLPSWVESTVFCHSRALNSTTVGYDVVRFDLVRGSKNCEAASVRKVPEFKLISSANVGMVMSWHENKVGKKYGWIQSASDDSSVYCPESQCLAGKAMVGSLVQYDVQRSCFDDQDSATGVLEISGETVAENAVGRVSYLNHKVGYISVGYRNYVKFAREALVDATIEKGDKVCFDHKKFGDFSFTLHVSHASENNPVPVKREQTRSAPQGREQGWVCRTFKQKEDDTTVAVIACINYDVELLWYNYASKGDLVEFDLVKNLHSELKAMNVAKIGSSFTTPLCKCGGRHLFLRCPARKANKHHEANIPMAGAKSKLESDQCSVCSTAVPSEVRA